MSLKTVDVVDNTFFLAVEGGNGVGVQVGVGLEGVLDSDLEGSEEGNESLDVTFVGTVLGDLDEGVHDGLVLLGLSESDGVLEELAGDLAQLNEGSTLGELGGDINSIIDGVDGVIEGDGSTVVGVGFLTSYVLDEGKVLSVLDEDLLGESELAGSLILGKLGGSELLVGASQGVGGIEDLGASVLEFTGAFGGLTGIDFIVGDLFLVDGILESIEDSLDGVKGTT